ncbi:Thaumatin-like protein [Ananas comosus]|uniref:Thaumatin-like protein n=1 Tax=Ananas comosus TaxID=4615 RepID=A0A199VIV3_ANACO|nr:Thaumatin-like protein [Ananas comosus]
MSVGLTAATMPPVVKKVVMLLTMVTAGVVLSGGVGEGATLAMYNKCRETVWPGIQPGAGKAVVARGGMRLQPGQATSVRLPAAGRAGSGPPGLRLRPRHRPGACATGDCGGSSSATAAAAPPATLAEITLARPPDFYDVSLVDGYNIPMSMTPFRGTGGRCASAGCVSDLNEVCPAGLAVRGGADNRVVACKSACSAFGAPQYCCTGSYGSPQQCKPTAYSRLFKTACPKAYSYAYDDPTSIQTCGAGASYIVTFCPHYR